MARKKREEAKAKDDSLKQHEELVLDAGEVEGCDYLRVTDPDGDQMIVRASAESRATDGAGRGAITHSFAETGEYLIQYFADGGVEVAPPKKVTVK
jgi:hypothetical protein